jgi:hypothetical protein
MVGGAGSDAPGRKLNTLGKAGAFADVGVNVSVNARVEPSLIND